MRKEEWITIQETIEITGKHYETIRNWCQRDVIECKRAFSKGSSPLMINKLSIPSFLRKK